MKKSIATILSLVLLFALFSLAYANESLENSSLSLSQDEKMMEAYMKAVAQHDAVTVYDSLITAFIDAFGDDYEPPLLSIQKIILALM